MIVDYKSLVESPRTRVFDRMFAVLKKADYLLLGFLAIGVSGGCQTKSVCFGGACRVGYVYAPNSCRCVATMDAGTDANSIRDGSSRDAEDGSTEDDGRAAH